MPAARVATVVDYTFQARPSAFQEKMQISVWPGMTCVFCALTTGDLDSFQVLLATLHMIRTSHIAVAHPILYKIAIDFSYGNRKV